MNKAGSSQQRNIYSSESERMIAFNNMDESHQNNVKQTNEPKLKEHIPCDFIHVYKVQNWTKLIQGAALTLGRSDWKGLLRYTECSGLWSGC